MMDVIAIELDRSVIQKEAGNKLKYKNLSLEIQGMWIMKCFVISSNHGGHWNCN
jgi:hypothetical protein